MKKCEKMLKILCLFLTVLLVFCASGCKGGGDGDSPDAKKAAEEANRTLKIHCYNYETLNPLLQTSEVNMQMLRLVFESLIVCDNTQKAQCVLAEKYSVSPDGLVWTIKVKKGVKWHDQTPFTAYDVEKTYNAVLGYAEASMYYALLQNVEGVKAVSDTEVKFNLKKPQANFINLLDVPIIKGHSENFKPIGTGPYKYDGVSEKIITLLANENWQGEGVGVDKIEVRILPDKETAVYAYVAKEIDVVSVTSNADWNEYSSNADNVIVDYPSSSFNYITINTNTEPLSNRLLRVAIAQAINKEKICSEVLLSHGTVANSCMNSEWWVYNKGITNYSYSPKKAEDTIKALKNNTKIGTINLMVNSESADKCKTAEMIKENLNEVGLSVQIDYVSKSAFYERVGTGNYHMYIGTVKYAGDINPAYVVTNPDEKLSALLADLQKQTTEEGVKAKYFEVQEKIATDVNIIPLYFDNGSVMYNKRIKGEFNPFRTHIYNGIENIKLVEKYYDTKDLTGGNNGV